MDRRHFIQSAAALGASSMLPLPFSISTANAGGLLAPAANPSGYKALVCVFLFGGNDSHNMVVPYGASDYNAYSLARGGLAEANGLALPYADLKLLSSANLAANTLALHPAMANLQSLFSANKLAIVANSAPLLAPTTLAQYQARSVPLPPQLFSHSDMQMHWQTMRPDVPADTGWGGRMADVFRAAAPGQLPVTIGMGSGGAFMKGDIVSPYNAVPVRYSGGAIDPRSSIARTPNAWSSWDATANSQGVFKENYFAVRPNLLEQQFAAMTRSSLEVGEFVKSVMYNVDASGNYSFKTPVPGTWPTTNPLAAQLHAVAAMMGARQNLGVSRQVFFVTLGGFDNHGDQFGNTGSSKTLLSGKHYALMAYLDQALSTFYNATASMGISDSVTTMTMSDFGRTMKSNGQGSDHGWGGHQLVLGGQVNGGRVYGRFPFSGLMPQLDVGEGRLLPEIAADVYTARLAQWFGADAADLAAIFPNLSRFDQSPLATLMA